jgi:hydrogenase-4 component B
VSAERASYGPLLFLVMTAVIVLLAFVLVRRFYHGRVRRVTPWDCGFPMQTARMQDTAEGFGQPIRQIFDPFFKMNRELPTPFDSAPRYKVTFEDPLWGWVYLRIAAATEAVSRWVGLLQRGRISIYLLYSFLTLVFMLFLTQA